MGGKGWVWLFFLFGQLPGTEYVENSLCVYDKSAESSFWRKYGNPGNSASLLTKRRFRRG